MKKNTQALSDRLLMKQRQWLKLNGSRIKNHTPCFRQVVNEMEAWGKTRRDPQEVK